MFDWRNLPLDIKQRILRSRGVRFAKDWTDERINNSLLSVLPKYRRSIAANTIRKAWTSTLPRFPMTSGRAQMQFHHPEWRRACLDDTTGMNQAKVDALNRVGNRVLDDVDLRGVMARDGDGWLYRPFERGLFQHDKESMWCALADFVDQDGRHMVDRYRQALRNTNPRVRNRRCIGFHRGYIPAYYRENYDNRNHDAE